MRLSWLDQVNLNQVDLNQVIHIKSMTSYLIDWVGQVDQIKLVAKVNKTQLKKSK